MKNLYIYYIREYKKTPYSLHLYDDNIFGDIKRRLDKRKPYKDYKIKSVYECKSKREFISLLHSKKKKLYFKMIHNPLGCNYIEVSYEIKEEKDNA